MSHISSWLGPPNRKINTQDLLSCEPAKWFPPEADRSDSNRDSDSP
jgi:hypothetical protein